MRITALKIIFCSMLLCLCSITSAKSIDYVQDYMGNNRLVVDGRADDTIEQKTHYYPYGPRSHKKKIDNLLARRRGLSEGRVIGDLSTNQNLQDFKFEGKELDRSFGLDWYDIHARQFDAIGVPGWNKPDPLAGDYTGFSPYAMCAGNPVNLGDYDGKDIIDAVVGVIIGVGTDLIPCSGSFRERNEIKHKIQNIIRDAQRKAAGENHSQGVKR